MGKRKFGKGRPLGAALLLTVLAAGGCGGPKPENAPPTARTAAVQREASLRSAIRTAPRDPRPHLELIRFLGTERRYCDALDAAREAHQLFPESGAVREALAEALAVTARLPEAVEVMRPLAKVDPAHRVRLAGYLVRDGRRGEAVTELARLGRPSPEVALRAGQVYLDALRPESAVALFRVAHEARPQNTDAQAHLGLALILSGRYVEAVEVLDALVGRSGDVGALQYYLGSALRLSADLNRLPEAADHLRRAAELEPNAPLYHYELGLAHVQLRDWSAAASALERAAVLKPDLAEVQRDLARLYDRQGDPVRAAIARSRYLRLLGDAPAAVRELVTLTKKHPADLSLALELGEAYYDSWQTPSTLALLRRLEASHPEDARVLTALYRGERAANRDEKSLQALDQLLKLTPQGTELLVERAELLQSLGRYAELEALLTQLRDREPENPARHYQLGLVLSQWSTRKDRTELAEASFREVIRLRPEDALGHYRLGLLLMSARRAGEAIPHFRRSLDLSPRSSDTLRALARAYVMTNDKKRSEEAFRAYRVLNARDEEQKRLEMPSSLHRATAQERERLAEFYVRAGHYEAAVTELEAVLHARPGDGAARTTLAALYGHLRRFQRHFEERDVLRRDK